MHTKTHPGAVKAFVALTAVILSASWSHAQEVGKITYAEGRVEIFRSAETTASPLREDDTVFVGDSIRTKTNSKVEVTFKDNSVVQLAQDTKINIKDYQLTDDLKRKEATLSLERGKMRAIIEKEWKKADFNITTPNTQGTLKGSEVFAFYQAGSTGMLVSAGNLSVVNPLQPQTPPVVVVPGNSILVSPSGEFQGPRPYLELEKQFHEQDTSPPPSVRRKKNLDTIEGAVAKISGDVRITPKGENQSHALQVHEIVKAADTIDTGADGVVEIRFSNGNSLHLKPNTHLVIVKMVIDAKTQDYESLLEVTTGSVKAVVENLKDGSSFKVRTPQATSGVRGTIMYLTVSSEQTQSFFEGGPGFIESLFSGTIEDVGIGETATADNLGNITEPIPVSEADRAGLTEGFETSADSEGYSPPEGYLYDSDAGIDTGEGANGNSESTTNGSVTIPITESNTSLLLKKAQTILEAVNDLFVVNKTFTPRVRVSDFDDGTLQGWTKVLPFGGDLLVDQPGGNPHGFMVTTDTAGGGVLYAQLPAAALGLLDNSSGVFWDEFVYDNGAQTTKKIGLIIQGPDGTQYVSVQDLDNVIEAWANRFVSLDEQSSWTIVPGSGSATFAQVVNNIAALYLSTETSTVFIGNRESGIDNISFLLDDSHNITIQSLVGQISRNEANNQGTYNLVANGTFQNTLPAGWQVLGITGQTNASGEFVGGSWLAGVNGTEWTDNGFEGVFNGLWLELRKDGTLSGKVMEGDVLGNYVDVEEEQTWQAASSGDWVEADSLIDPDNLAGDILALATPVVPITEAYTSILSGAGVFNAGGTLSIDSLFLDFFANDLLALSGIWAANVSGQFTAPSSDNWSVNVNGNLIDATSNETIGTVNATLTGTQWNDGNWQANVSGSTNTGMTLTGQTAGTFDNGGGTFTGGGVGTFEQPAN